jgi:hypothetical protein
MAATLSSSPFDDFNDDDHTPSTSVVDDGEAKIVRSRPIAGARKLPTIESFDSLESLLTFINSSDHEKVYAGNHLPIPSHHNHTTCACFISYW